MSKNKITLNEVSEISAEPSEIADNLNLPKTTIYALLRAFKLFASEYRQLSMVITNDVEANPTSLEFYKEMAEQEEFGSRRIIEYWGNLLGERTGKIELPTHEYEKVAKVFIGFIRDELAKDKLFRNESTGTSNNDSSFVLIDKLEIETPELTLQYLIRVVYPYIQSIAELQQLIDQIHNRPSKIVIKSIQQNSPVSVSLDGASDAIQLIKETVVPWRRKHAETMANLLEQEKLAEIELKRAEVLEKRAVAAKERELTDKLKVENEKLRAETSLQQAKVQLATEMIKVISMNFDETEKERLITKLSPVLDVLALGRLEMVIDK